MPKTDTTTIRPTPLHTRMVDRLAAFAGIFAIRRLFDSQCEEYLEGCCNCEVKKILDVMEDIAYDL